MNASSTHAPPDLHGPLARWTSLRVEGPEAGLFLQSQLGSDVNALAVAQSQWSAWLNPKGRVIALGLLLRSDERVFEWFLPDHPAEPLAHELRRFLLRRKATIDVPADRQIWGGFGAPAADACIVLGGAIRRWLAVRASAAPRDPIDAPWLASDLLTGIARIDAQGGSHTAHMLGLDRIEAVSVRKGCYPGQEIVARTHFLGQSKRGLVCLSSSLTSAPAAGRPVLLEGQAVGEVIRSITGPEGTMLIQSVAAGLQAGDHCSCDELDAEVLDLGAPPVPLA